MNREKKFKHLKCKSVQEVEFPTWPTDTETMIRHALYLMSDRGED